MSLLKNILPKFVIVFFLLFMFSCGSSTVKDLKKVSSIEVEEIDDIVYLLQDSIPFTGVVIDSTYDFSGTPAIEIQEYKNGLVDGVRICLEKNGDTLRVGHWTNGELNGKVRWYKNGKFSSDANYVNGDREIECECCGKLFFDSKGWYCNPGIRWGKPFQDNSGNNYCTKKCAIECCK